MAASSLQHKGAQVSHVFISYARADKAYAARLAQALEKKGFTVWWDWDLIGGSNFRTQIREAITTASKAVVLWSKQSVESGFVIDEANEAKKFGKLVPLLIDGAQPPFGFGDLHTITVKDLDRDIDAIVAALNDQPPARQMPSRRTVSKGLIAAGVAGVAFAGAGLAYLTSGDKTGSTESGTKAAAPGGRGNRTALVIGNGGYRHVSTLANPRRDADAVATALTERGFKVIKIHDADRASMQAAFGKFEQTLSIVGGVGLFYYAGSAAFIDGEDLLIPVDVPAKNEAAAIAHGLNLTQLRREIRSSTTSALADNGTATIYAASKGQIAGDGPAGGHSPFTTALLKSLNDGEELADTFRAVRTLMRAEQVAAGTTFKQDPFMESDLSRPFYFNHPERDGVEGASRILIFDSCRETPFRLHLADQPVAR